MLENLILDVLEVHDCNIIICGDLNSRTGRLNTQNNFDFQDMTSTLFDNTRESQVELLILLGNLYFLYVLHWI